MKLEVYAVHDAAVGAFNRPLFFRSRGEAIRAFQDAVLDTQSGFSAHGADYSFYVVGDFDDLNGQLISREPERVCGAKDFILPDAPFPVAHPVKHEPFAKD